MINSYYLTASLSLWFTKPSCPLPFFVTPPSLTLPLGGGREYVGATPKTNPLPLEGGGLGWG